MYQSVGGNNPLHLVNLEPALGTHVGHASSHRRGGSMGGPVSAGAWRGRRTPVGGGGAASSPPPPPPPGAPASSDIGPGPPPRAARPRNAPPSPPSPHTTHVPT